MSEGARIPLERAERAAEMLTSLWRSGASTGPGPELVVVGSVRRRKDTVGDLEFLARRPADGEKCKYDPLYDAIARTMPSDALFTAVGGSPIGDIVKGFKRGFANASFLIRLAGSPQTVLKVEVYRADLSTMGWHMLMRTGPAEFGKWFLGRWKDAFGIPATRPASVGGVLCDAEGQPVPVFTEEECFQKIRRSYVAPEHREAFVRRHAPGLFAAGGVA